MRLVCPSCDAEYEIARTAIPRSGREVECSNCGHSWFQAFADLRIDEAVLDAPDETPNSGIETAPDLPRPMDDDVLDVLRQEAEREVQARLAEASRSGLETQTEMSLAHQDAGARHLHALRAAGDNTPPQQDTRPRRELLPAIDEVSANLRVAPTPPAPAYTSAPSTTARPSPLVRGLLFVILIGVICLALYVFAPLIAQKVPALAQTCADYVEAVDQGIRWTQGHWLQAVAWLKAFW
jgi:predicted Zn finger-like uncharacterized protein